MHAFALLPMGMGAASGAAAAPTDPPPSFSDGTPTEPSELAMRGDEHTRDLYDVALPGQWVVIRGATVWTMAGSVSLPNHDVLALDGLIRSVQPSGLALPAGALVVEAAGKHVIPGLSENHCHPMLVSAGGMYAPLFGPEVCAEQIVLPYDLQMFLYLAGGVTRIQPMFGTMEELALRDAVRSGRIRGPSMRVASPLIDGYPPVWRPSVTYLVNDAEGGRQAARQIAERGYDFAKPYTRLSRAGFDGLAAECRALGVEITGHIPAAVPVEHALEQGQRGVAHVFELFYNESDGERRNLDRMAQRARLCKQLGVTVHTTLVAAVAFEFDIGQREVTYTGMLDPVIRHLLKPGGLVQSMFQADPQIAAQGRDVLSQSVQMTRALHREGVCIVSGTDIPNSNATGEHTIHDELEMYVREVGMTALEALRCATINSAHHHGEAATAGTLEAGKRCELVVLERDPSHDIGATRSIDAVVIGSAVLTHAAIARGVERARRLYAAMPVPQ